MKSVARIEKTKVTMAVKIDGKRSAKLRKTGDVWRGNLFRCVGGGDTRGYLAWQPTYTD
jgi:hypothetical protein